MKKILFTAVSALALAAFADGVNSTEFGVLPVPSSAAETIVSVPWLASGTGSADVKVCDLVLTAGLTASEPGVTGDTLKYYDGSNWQVWVLTETAGTKSWQPSEGGATAETTVVRGRALILKRPNATTRADKFYIMGKPTDATGSVDLNQGYTLIAPPFATATDVNSLTWTTGAEISSTKDSLMVPTGDSKGSFVTLSYVGAKGNKKWKKWTGSAWQEGYTIPAGMGAWFVNGESSVKKVSW